MSDVEHLGAQVLIQWWSWRSNASHLQQSLKRRSMGIDHALHHARPRVSLDLSKSFFNFLARAERGL
ncbi:MAG: hypothetical protein AABP62_24065 [Planctomycetota bacterium]